MSGRFLSRASRPAASRPTAATGVSAAQTPKSPVQSTPPHDTRHPTGQADDPLRSGLPPTVAGVVSRAGEPLEPRLGASLRGHLGHDLGSVRIHRDGVAAASARALGAAAYAVGPHIVFGADAYAPRTPRGNALLLHELAHSLHQMSSGTIRPGLAPASDGAEQRAQEFSVSHVGDARRGTVSFHDWGRPWAVHAQRVTTAGSSVFREERLGLAPGEHGAPVGTVEVHTGAAVGVSKGAIESNLLAISYQGSLSAETRWLQFVWFELVATTPGGPRRVAGSIPTSSGTLPFTTTPATPSWAVDSGPGDPFYESGALAIRTSGATTIFDRPGGTSVQPLARSVFAAGVGATAATFVAHFETYLVQRNRAIYSVPWSAATAFRNNRGTPVGGAVAYSLGSPGNVSGLPTNFKTLLHARYPTFSHVQ